MLKLKTKEKKTTLTELVEGGTKDPIGGGGGGGNPKDEEFLPVKGLYTNNPKDGNSYNTRTTTVQGSNNIVDRTANSVSIVGDSNVVSSETRNVVIQNGDNNFISSNIENISLINTSGVTVTESDVTYINGELRGEGSVVTIDSQTTADESVVTYLCDTSAGDVKVILPESPTVGKIWNFKKMTIDNQIQLVTTPPQTIDGLLIGYIDALNNSYSVQFDGLNYKII